MPSGPWRTALALLATTLACNTARPLRPLPRGAFDVDVSLPAAVVRTTAAAFPIGELVVGGRYGVLDDLELSLHLHPAALVTGTLALETGATWQALAADGGVPGLHLSSHVLVLTHFAAWSQAPAEAARGVFELEVAAHWEPLPWLWPYVVLEDAVVLEDGAVVASVMVGVQSWVTPRVALSLETGLAGLGQRSRDLTASYVGVAGHGSLWIGLAVSYRFDPVVASTDRAR